MNNQEIIDNAPKNTSIVDSKFKFFDDVYCELDKKGEWNWKCSMPKYPIRSLADIKRIVELEGFNVGLAEESCAQQKRIVELENQWISVEDRLPEIGDFCLAYMERRGSSITNTVNTQYTKYGFERSSVTHWMPLPSPPKEQGND